MNEKRIKKISSPLTDAPSVLETLDMIKNEGREENVLDDTLVKPDFLRLLEKISEFGRMRLRCYPSISLGKCNFKSKQVLDNYYLITKLPTITNLILMFLNEP